MNFAEFIDVMAKQLFVYKYAKAMNRPQHDGFDERAERRHNGQIKSARTRMRNAERKIEDAVLAFAREITTRRTEETLRDLEIAHTVLGARTGRFVTHLPPAELKPRNRVPGTIDDERKRGKKEPEDGN